MPAKGYLISLASPISSAASFRRCMNAISTKMPAAKQFIIPNYLSFNFFSKTNGKKPKNPAIKQTVKDIILFISKDNAISALIYIKCQM